MRLLPILLLLAVTPAQGRDAPTSGQNRRRHQGIHDLRKCGRDCPTGTHSTVFKRDEGCGGEAPDYNAVRCSSDQGEGFTTCSGGCAFGYYEDPDGGSSLPECGDRPGRPGPATRCRAF